MQDVQAVLLDIDGVLVTSWHPLPGALETLAWLRQNDVPFRLITNTTTHTRSALAKTLADAGIAVSANEIVTAVVATGSYLRTTHPGAQIDAVRSTHCSSPPASDSSASPFRGAWRRRPGISAWPGHPRRRRIVKAPTLNEN